MLQKEAQICQNALAYNLAKIRKNLANDEKIVACVKANAYGHGLYEVMPVLSSADACYVHSWDAALSLRRDYPDLPIILAGFVGNVYNLQHLVSENIDWVVFNHEQLELLQQANYTGKSFNVWLKIDTGMNRLGFSIGEAHKAINELEYSPFVSNIVLMTHYACAQDVEHYQNIAQQEKFEEFIIKYPYLHTSIGNTAMACHKRFALGDYVRVGAGLYGLSPFSASDDIDLDLMPVMTLRARVISVKYCQVGEYVGYNSAWQCLGQKAKLVVISFGYADGYLRSIKAGAPIFINGEIARVVGAISMDTIVAKVADNASVVVGDWAELWGNNIAVDTVADYGGTIGYELTCGIGRRVKRTIVRNQL